MDDLTRSQLNEYFATLNEVSSRLQTLTMPSNIVHEPFVQVEQWRQDAYRQIDAIAEKKREEVQTKIDEYRPLFDRTRHEQLEKIARYKQKVADLFRKTQVAQKELSQLKRSVEQIQTDATCFDRHGIEVTANRPLIHSVSVRMRCQRWKVTSPSSSSSSSSSVSPVIRQLQFRLKCVRLTGSVTAHELLVDVNGTVGDLIDRLPVEHSRKKTNDDKRERERVRFLATEVSQQGVRQRFVNDTPLQLIFNQIESLVFYEMPLDSAVAQPHQSCVLFCRFDGGLPWDIHFGLPFVLHVPRVQCRADDLRRLLDQTVQRCFPIIGTGSSLKYEVRLVASDQHTSTPIVLNEWADRVIDDHLLMADDVTLLVNVIDVDRSQCNELPVCDTRVDESAKANARRRTSRK
jgi:hypothetical protein